METPENFGHRLRRLRRRRGLSQRALANLLGVTYQTISKWELSVPGMCIGSDSLKKIANFFNVRPEWLQTGEGDPRPEPLAKNWPAEELQAHGIVVPELPHGWPTALQTYVSLAVRFALLPSSTGLAQLLHESKNMLGSMNIPLPPELELAVRAADVSPNPATKQDPIDRYLNAVDVALDMLEDIRLRQTTKKQNHDPK